MKKLPFVLAGLVALGIGCWFTFYKPIPFSSETWKREQNRLRMLDDLLNSSRLIGLTTPEVEELLGPSLGGIQPFGCYFVGNEWSEFPFSAVLLYVEFEDGICTKAYRHNKF